VVAPDPALPPEAWLVALADLPGMGPARLGALLQAYGPAEAWQAVRECELALDPAMAPSLGGGARAITASWRSAAATVDVASRWADHAGLRVRAHGRPGYPAALARDLDPPALLFMRGSPALLDGVRVAVVGTRRCSAAGFETARDLGRDLAVAGVHVVSGLALGIDGAAHRGALDALAADADSAPPIGVVACGLDVVYPKRHRDLWEEVATRGLLLSECPLGTRPERWRFPARNRIIAALADALVVVESPGHGGSMWTVDQANDRGVAVFAMPGPVRSAASAGTNQLLFDGAHMARDATDVLTFLGLVQAEKRARDERVDPGPEARRVLRALGWEPATLDTLARRTSLELGPLSVAVTVLEAGGWIQRQGLWFERIGAR